MKEEEAARAARKLAEIEAERARKALEQTLYDAGVDLILNGHVHSYERSHPVLNYGLNDCAPVHIVVGDGGNYEGPYGESWMVPQPAYSAFREGSFGAGSLVIHNDTHASWEWRRTTCVANTTTFSIARSANSASSNSTQSPAFASSVMRRSVDMLSDGGNPLP